MRDFPYFFIDDLKKCFRVGRRIKNQHFRLAIRHTFETVYGAARGINEITSTNDVLLPCDNETNLTLDNIVRLVPRMAMRWRSGMLWQNGFYQRPALAGVICRAQELNLRS